MARLNENENENENEGSGGGREGLFAGSRYNTYKIGKQAFNTNMTASAMSVARASRCPGYDQMGGWDPEDKGWLYLMDFIELEPNWLSQLKTLATDTWNGWIDAGGSFRQRLDSDGMSLGAELDFALCDIVDAAGEREDRFAEILHQRDAAGCITYWTGMLGVDPVKHPNTNQLIRIGRKLGEMIVMRLKVQCNAARPSQICPALVPMFDPPRTAAYPAGHSLQSYLISYLLFRVMPNISPQLNKPSTWEKEHTGLFALARRVADNRVIAGVHFDIDCKAGFLIAQRIDLWFDVWEGSSLQAFSNFRQLLEGARNEFPQYN